MFDYFRGEVYYGATKHTFIPKFKKWKKSTPKKFHIIQEMELSGSNIKKILIFSEEKNFMIFLEIKPCTFQPKLEKLKKCTSRKFLKRNLFLYFRKWKPWKNFLYFLKRKLFLYFRKQNFLIFGKGIFRTLVYLEPLYL